MMKIVYAIMVVTLLVGCADEVRNEEQVSQGDSNSADWNSRGDRNWENPRDGNRGPQGRNPQNNRSFETFDESAISNISEVFSGKYSPRDIREYCQTHPECEQYCENNDNRLCGMIHNDFGGRRR